MLFTASTHSFVGLNAPSCAYLLFQNPTEGWLPTSARAVGGMREDPIPSNAASQDWPQEPGPTRMPGEGRIQWPHSQGLLSASRHPHYFSWQGMLAIPRPVSHPLSLPAYPSWGRPHAQPWGSNSLSNLTQPQKSYGSRGGHVTWFWPRRCTGKSARWLPEKTFL